MLRVSKVIGLLAAMLSLAGIGGAADDAPLESKDVQAAVKKYAKDASKDDLKAVGELDPLVDVAKLKAGEGLEVVPGTDAKDYAFVWTYSAKKKLSEDEEGRVEKAGRDLLVAAVTAEKDALKLDAAGLKVATKAAKSATFKGKQGTAVGPTPGAAGELEIAKLTEAQVRDSVRSHLAAVEDKLRSDLDLHVYVTDLLDANGVTYSYEGGKPAFGWKYAARKADLATEDQKKVTDKLREVLAASLNSEKDKAKKLKPDDLKTAEAAIVNAQVEPKPFSKVYDLSTENFQEWVKQYVTDHSSVLDTLKDRVDTSLISDPTTLVYDADAKQLSWSYFALRQTMSAADETDIGNQLKALLRAAVEENAKGYPKTDLPLIRQIIDAGQYRVQINAGLRPEEVDQEKIQQMVRLSLTPREQAALSGLGVALADQNDVDSLVRGLTFKADPISFKWVYRWADPSKPPTDAQKEEVARRLRALLAYAVEHGGGDPALRTEGEQSLRMEPTTFESRFKGPIAKTETTPELEFSLAQLTPSVVRDLVEQYINVRKPAQVRELEKSITISHLYDANVLKYDPEKVSFSLNIPTSDKRTKDLTPDEVTKVKDLAKEVLTQAFARPVGGNRYKLNKADLDKVTAAVKKADITIMPLKESKILAQLIADQRTLRIQQENLRRRIADLEAKIDRLQPNTPSVPQATIQYEVQRSGIFGCRRTIVPVIVPCP